MTPARGRRTDAAEALITALATAIAQELPALGYVEARAVAGRALAEARAAGWHLTPHPPEPNRNRTT